MPVLEERRQIYPQVYIGDNAGIGMTYHHFAGARVYSDCNREGLYVAYRSGRRSRWFRIYTEPGKPIPESCPDRQCDHETTWEIGAGTVDRATLGSTIILQGAKLDNLIQDHAHNVEIGENTVITAQTGVTGSTKIGRDCGHDRWPGWNRWTYHNRGSEVKIAAQSGIRFSIVTPGEIVQVLRFLTSATTNEPMWSSGKFPSVGTQDPELEQMLVDLKQLMGCCFGPNSGLLLWIIF